MTLIAFGPLDTDGPGLTSDAVLGGITADPGGITISIETADHDDTLRIRFDRATCDPAIFAILAAAKQAAA